MDSSILITCGAAVTVTPDVIDELKGDFAMSRISSHVVQLHVGSDSFPLA